MYKSSGLAEIVRDPSPITISYFDNWFRGDSSFGQALLMLGWPVTPDNSPLLVWSKKHGLRLDLKVEEKIMYTSTIFHYIERKGDYILAIDARKLLLPNKIIGTLKALWSQSKLLVSYQETFNLARSYIASIPMHVPTEKSGIERLLTIDVWPRVIAVDYIGEFIYHTMTYKLSNAQKSQLIQKIHARTSPRDWYTQSVLAWHRYQDNEMTQQEFLAEYGYASGDDYELTKPRYYEVLRQSKPQVGLPELASMSIHSLEDLYVGLQYLRSEAKRRSLVWISALRDVAVDNKSHLRQKSSKA